MADDMYTVKISRRDGVVEITGTDKDWIAAQIDKLAAVYATPLEENPGGPGDDAGASEEEVKQEKPKAPRKRRPARSATTPTKPSDLEAKLTKPVTDEFHRYMDERPAASKSHQNRAAVIATFVMDELDQDSIDGHDLIAVYRAMGWAPPKNPSAVIRNAIDRNHYFGGWRDGRVHLTPTGEHFGRHGSKTASESD